MNCFSFFLFFYILSSCSGDNIWNKFATSDIYTNFKLVFQYNSAQLVTLYYPVSLSVLESKMSCARECSNNADCLAFNFYVDGTQYTCELLADNFCLKTSGRLALQIQPNGVVYDKLPDGADQTCLEQAFATASASDWCNIARPGCTGTWPVCDTCVKSCIDCTTFYNYSNKYPCTLWPEGTYTTPIFASCYNKLTYIIIKWVDMVGISDYWYTMPFEDVNRISSLNVYPILQFYSQIDSPFTWYVGYYKYSTIDALGTITNLTYDINTTCSNCADGLQLGQTVLATAPFVEVTDPSSSCGSFWQINPTNPTNCPGGGVVELLRGVKRRQNGNLMDTGIRWTGASPNYGDVTLAVL